MKIPALMALTVVLSILAASAAQAVVQPGHGGEVRNGQSQGQNGGHVHNDGGGKVGSDF